MASRGVILRLAIFSYIRHYVGHRKGAMERLPQDLLQEIANLQNMSAEELIRRYGNVVGYDVKSRRPELLRKLIAYRIQEVHYGVSLSTKDVQKIRDVLAARQERKATLLAVPNKEGTRVARVWKGVEYEVTLLADGRVSYKGVLYSSLTAVASRITGTHWNGRKFFGVS